MLLSELPKHTPLTVQRDAEFATLGLLGRPVAGMLTFAESDEFLGELPAEVRCVITTSALAASVPADVGLATAASPRRSFYMAHNALASAGFYRPVRPSVVAPDASVHPTAYVEPDGVEIASGARIEAHATVLAGSVVGHEAVVGPGSVVGGAGFEFKRFGDEVMRVQHAGGVVLGDRVEIQANCTVDRGLFKDLTRIGDDTKLDNLVHIAHNCVIGRRCLVAACAMVAGSVHLGDDVWIGPGASISNQLTIADGATVSIGAVVTRDVGPGERVSGNFAINHDRFLSFLRTIR
jgi:UDP-3-O-[3-hydroxymyristoyl] glucosamine N-acyltransferase